MIDLEYDSPSASSETLTADHRPTVERWASWAEERIAQIDRELAQPMGDTDNWYERLLLRRERRRLRRLQNQNALAEGREGGRETGR